MYFVQLIEQIFHIKDMILKMQGVESNRLGH